jgi:hypothetical protein
MTAPPTPTARYPYCAPDGALLCEVLRYDPKRFELRGPAGELLEDFPRDVGLYRLPELCAADPGETIFVPEGEKDVDRLRAGGLIATTNPGGTRRGWRAAYSRSLQERHVVVLPDADGPGKRHAASVAADLAGTARSVVLLELPRTYGRDDVSDWLARGNTIAKLLELVAAARYARAGLSGAPRGPEKQALIFGTGTLDSTSKLVLLAMLHSTTHGGLHPGTVEVKVPALAGMAGLHRVTAQRTIGCLRAAGVLRRTAGGHVIAWDILAGMHEPA